MIQHSILINGGQLIKSDSENIIYETPSADRFEYSIYSSFFHESLKNHGDKLVLEGKYKLEGFLRISKLTKLEFVLNNIVKIQPKG